MSEKLSLVIPCYNEEKTLRSIVEQILHLRDRGVELELVKMVLLFRIKMTLRNMTHKMIMFSHLICMSILLHLAIVTLMMLIHIQMRQHQEAMTFQQSN